MGNWSISFLLPKDGESRAVKAVKLLLLAGIVLLGIFTGQALVPE